jgi:hypothetical protein
MFKTHAGFFSPDILNLLWVESEDARPISTRGQLDVQMEGLWRCAKSGSREIGKFGDIHSLSKIVNA